MYIKTTKKDIINQKIGVDKWKSFVLAYENTHRKTALKKQFQNRSFFLFYNLSFAIVLINAFCSSFVL